MARVSEAVDVERLIRSSGNFTLHFICPDPHSYAMTDETFTISTEGTHTVTRTHGSADSAPVYYLRAQTTNRPNSYVDITTNNIRLRVGDGVLVASQELVIDASLVTAKVVNASTGETIRNGMHLLKNIGFPVLRKGGNTVQVQVSPLANSSTPASFTELRIQARNRWR